ncbi:hypothetical protein LCGC14_1472000 [marine sediment metagenome]|uniref:Uncharacterized protein n=1 Tax=marine sediment metagenome TaxID=412755 RepID=A0A0F9JCS7_9ZZZZ
MKWLRLIIEIILWVIAFAAIIRGMKSTDGLMFGYGLFIFLCLGPHPKTF